MIRARTQFLGSLVGAIFSVLSLAPTMGQAAVSCGAGRVDDGAQIFDVLDNPVALKELLDAGADPDTRSAMVPTLKNCVGPAPDIGNHPILRAAYLGHAEAVEILLNAGASIEVTGLGSNILLYATKDERNRNSLRVTSLLLDRFPGLAEQAAPALIFAVRYGNHALLDDLLARDVPTNTAYVPPWSGRDTLALTTAAQAVDLYAVRALLAHGADANLRPDGGSTALIAVIDFPRYMGSPDYEPTAVQIIDLLLSRGAQVDCTGSFFSMSGDGNNALTAAVHYRSVPAIKRMLAANPGQDTLRQAIDRARNNVNGVKPIDATIIGLLETAIKTSPTTVPKDCRMAAPAE